ncbi:PBECR3 domain-containing polyvalent protein, partial [Helicobacter bizzozeronii]
MSSAALRYHIKAALNKSASVQDFKIQLNHLVQRQDFDNATKALIRELEGGLPPDEPPPSGGGGGGIANPHLGDSGGKPPRGGELPPTGGKGEEPKRLSLEEIKRLIDESPSKGRDMVIIGRVNFSPAVVDYLLEFKEPSKKIAIEHLEPSKAQELGFKYPTDVRRTIDKSEILHVLERHGENGTIKQAREQPAVTKEDIAKYPQYTDQADFQVLGSNHAGEVIISGKQINGHYVVVEQIRKGQNELAFKTMYFERGDLRNNPAFDSVMLQEHPKHPSYELGLGQTTDTKTNPNSTTQELKNQATELFNTAKEKEAGFKGLLEGLKGASSELEASNLLKSVESIESKIRRKQGDITAIGDFLRAAIRVEHRGQLNSQLIHIEDSLRAQGIEPTIELHHRQSGYKGVHIQFNYNGVASEIQLHTNNTWGTKKELDPIYHVMRDPKELAKLTPQELENLKLKSRQIAQGFDLDISDFTSYMVKSDSASNSEKSVLVRKSPTEGKPTQEPLEKSNSNRAFSEGDTAYKRPESELSRNSSFSGDSGKSIQTPLKEDSTTPQTSPLSIHQQALQARQAREQAKLEAKALEEQKQAQREAQEQERRTQAAK